MIAQYLRDEGYTASDMVLQDETGVKRAENEHDKEEFVRTKTAILDGLWTQALAGCAALFQKRPVASRGFLYAVHKQVYLEHLERREYQQAFNYLTKRIKTLESAIPTEEMRDLCYLLACTSIKEAPSFRSWERTTGRQQLVEHLASLLRFSEHPPARGEILFF